MRNLSILSVAVLMACGETLPQVDVPKVSLREANCKVGVLLDVLKDSDELVNAVLDNDLSIQDAVVRAGGTLQEGEAAMNRFFECEPLQALPPSYGNKVM